MQQPEAFHRETACGRRALMMIVFSRLSCIWHFDHQRQMIVDDTSAAGADDRGRFALLDNRGTVDAETGIKCVTIINRGFPEAMLGKVGESLPLQAIRSRIRGTVSS